MNILGFDKYNEITSSRIRINKIEESNNEVCYKAIFSINGEKIKGEIFTEKNGDLECFQFYDKNGIDISEIYGQEIIEKIIINKLKKLKKDEI
jgi:hypothetical protein